MKRCLLLTRALSVLLLIPLTATHAQMLPPPGAPNFGQTCPGAGALCSKLPVHVYLTLADGNTHTWTVPSDWNNADNTVEAIGGGGAGESTNPTDEDEPAGGGGGAYSAVRNLKF